VFTKSGIKDAILAVFPQEVANRIISMGDWINNNLMPVLKDLGSNVLRIISGAIDSLTSSSSNGNGVVQLFTGSLNLLNDALGWLADHQSVLNAIVQLLVVKFIGGLVASVTGTLVANITSLATAIGEGGLAGAMGELVPFAASNPILAVAVGISTLIIGSIVTYTEKIREMKNEAKALQDLVKNGISSDADYKKVTSTSKTAKSKLLQNQAIEKQKNRFQATNPISAPQVHEYLWQIKDLGTSKKDAEKARSIAKNKLKIDLPKNLTTAPKMFEYLKKKLITDVLGHDYKTFQDSKVAANDLNKEKSSNKKWFDKNGFYDMSDKQIQAFLKKMDVGAAFYKKLQNWQDKSLKGQNFSDSEKAEMKKIENGIINVNKERANSIKNKPSILKNEKIMGLASLPYKSLTKAQKKQVDEYNKVLKEYYNKIKQNSAKYTWYGTTLNYKDTVLKDVKEFLKPKAKATTAKATDPNKLLQEYIEKQAKTKQTLAKKIKAVKSTYAEKIQNFTNDALFNLVIVAFPTRFSFASFVKFCIFSA
jgi:uncharacterized membrane protein (DUF106 family)